MQGTEARRVALSVRGESAGAPTARSPARTLASRRCEVRVKVKVNTLLAGVLLLIVDCHNKTDYVAL